MQRAIEYLISIFIFLIPWQARWVIRVGELNGNFWEYGTIALYATDVIFLGILLLSGVLWLTSHNTERVTRNSTSPSPRYRSGEAGQPSPMRRGSWYVACAVCYLLLSIFWSPDQFVALYAAVKLLEGIVLFVLLTRRYSEVELPKGGSTSLVGWAFVASAVMQSVLAIAQFLMQRVFAWPWSGIAPHLPSDLGASVVQFADERWLRAYGSFPHPNLLGAFLVLALMSLFMRYKTSPQPSPKGRGRMFYVLCFMVILTGLFFTFSRTAWIATILGVGIWIFSANNWRHRFTQQTVVILTTYCLLLTAIFWPLVRARVMGTESLEQRSTTERVAGYGEAWQLIKQHPLLGVGVGNYTKAVHDELRPADPAWSYQPVHNVFMLIFAELGIIGLLVLMCLLVYSFRVSQFLILLPLLPLVFLDHSFWTLHSGIFIFWAFLALSGDFHRHSTDQGSVSVEVS